VPKSLLAGLHEGGRVQIGVRKVLGAPERNPTSGTARPQPEHRMSSGNGPSQGRCLRLPVRRSACSSCHRCKAIPSRALADHSGSRSHLAVIPPVPIPLGIILPA
jgi:hypothetical protein